MARNPWPAQAASVIVLPSGKRGETLLEMAKSWSQSGILGQALWILPKEDLEASHNLAIKAQIFGRAQVIELDLFQQLAQNPLKTLRIIAIRLITDAKDEDNLQDQVISSLDRLTDVGVPVLTGQTGGTASGTDTLRINMIMAPSWVEEVKHRSLTEDRWTHNVIISPEDRTSPWGIDAFVREETNLYGITLANLASAGGLWMGVPKGSFELSHHNRSGVPGQIWLQRTFARGVLTESLAIQQAVNAMDSASNPLSNNLRPEIGLQADGIALIQEDSLHFQIDWMFDEIFKIDQGALTYRRYEGEPDLSKRRIGIGKQLKEFFIFAWDKTKNIPIWIFDAIVRWVSSKFNKTFQGEDGNAEVDANIDLKRVKLDSRDKEIRDQIYNLERIKKVALVNEKAPALSPAVRSNPKLWEMQRTFLFAMLDGSDGPAGIEMPAKEDRKLIFGRLRDLIFDVRDKWQRVSDINAPENHKVKFLEDLSEINWSNLSYANEALLLMKGKIAQVQKEIEDLESAAKAEAAAKEQEAAAKAEAAAKEEAAKAVDLKAEEAAKVEVPSSVETESAPEEPTEPAATTEQESQASDEVPEVAEPTSQDADQSQVSESEATQNEKN